jgi:hypothetical protein
LLCPAATTRRLLLAETVFGCTVLGIEGLGAESNEEASMTGKQSKQQRQRQLCLVFVCLWIRRRRERERERERERGAKELAAAGLPPLYWAPNGRRPRPITTKPKPYGPTDSFPFPNPDWTARRRQEKKKEGSTAAAAASFRRRL